MNVAQEIATEDYEGILSKPGRIVLEFIWSGNKSYDGNRLKKSKIRNRNRT